MSVEQLESAIKALPLEERRQIIGWFDDHRHELMGGDSYPGPEVRAELELRLRETNAHPESLETFEETDVEGMIQDAINAHAKKSPAGQG